MREDSVDMLTSFTVVLFVFPKLIVTARSLCHFLSLSIPGCTLQTLVSLKVFRMERESLSTELSLKVVREEIKIKGGSK